MVVCFRFAICSTIPHYIDSMNLLAHCALSGHHPQILVGNFIGDHVKGRDLSYLLPAVEHGVRLHRLIDSSVDSHPANKEAYEVVRSYAGRYSPPVCDVLFDHFLAHHWDHFYATPLPRFAMHVYAVLTENHEHLPPSVQRFLPYMIAQNWLLNYRTKTGLGHSLNGLAGRIKQPISFQDILGMSTERWQEMERLFLVVYPAVRAEAEGFAKQYQTKS